jgi:cell division initiation protein
MPRITVEDISRKEFSFANKGYNQKEVDDFLDDICDEIERMENEIMDLKQKTSVVRPAPQQESGGVSAESEQSFREVLAMAVQVKDETLRKAKEDAEAIRAKAETEAAERLDGLAEERKALEDEVAALRKAAADYRSQFEALLQAQQDALEKAGNLFSTEA